MAVIISNTISIYSINCYWLSLTTTLVAIQYSYKLLAIASKL